MNHRPSTVLIVGATGSIGRYAVAEALQHGYAVRALVRDQTRAARILPDGVDLVIGDLTRPATLGPAVDGADAIVFTALTPDSDGSLDGAEDTADLPTESEPELFRHDLATIAAGSLKAGD
jgi:uncharacterized protein YbjT (DUF2867 family)